MVLERVRSPGKWVRIRGLRGRWEAVSFNLHASVELKHEQHPAAYSICFDGSFMAIGNHRNGNGFQRSRPMPGATFRNTNMITNIYIYICNYMHVYIYTYMVLGGMAGMASCLWLKLLNLRVDVCSEMQIVRLVQ